MPDVPDKVHPPVPYERHVFVCCFGKVCPTRGGADLCGELKRRAKEAGIGRRIRVNRSGCLDQCDSGPVLVVYPECFWYAGFDEGDLDEIFEKTVLRGEPIPRLLHRNTT